MGASLQSARTASCIARMQLTATAPGRSPSANPKSLSAKDVADGDRITCGPTLPTHLRRASPGQVDQVFEVDRRCTFTACR